MRKKMRILLALLLLTRYSNRCQSAGCSFAKSIFLVALAFGKGASRSDRGLCPLRFGFASLAHIATYLSIVLIPGSLCAETHRVEVGGTYSYANLRVIGNESFQGNLGGAQGLYEYCPRNSFYGGAKASWKQGITESSHASRFLVYADVHERLGYSFSTRCRKWRCSLFSGLGYRYIGQTLHSNGQTVQFDYNELYVPFGALSSYCFSSLVSLGINATWMPQVFPTVKISPLKGARWILHNSLSNILVELPVVFKFSAYSLLLKPYYEHWGDGASIAVTASGNALGLPANIYNFWGVELNFGVCF
jgi:hypothetical protein